MFISSQKRYFSFLDKGFFGCTEKINIYPIIDRMIPLYANIYENLLNNSITVFTQYGGRGSGKTMNTALMLLADTFLDYVNGSIFIVFRDKQTDIKASVFTTLVKFVEELHVDRVVNGITTIKPLKELFTIGRSKQDPYIRNNYNNVEIRFKGLRDPESVKSSDSLARVWFEEASGIPRLTIDTIYKTARFTHHNFKDKRKVLCYFTLNPTRADEEAIQIARDYREDGLLKHINIFDLPKDMQSKESLKNAEREKMFMPKQLWDFHWLGKASFEASLYPFSKLNKVTNGEDIYNIIDRLIKKGSYSGLFCGVDPSYDGRDHTSATFMWEDIEDKLYDEDDEGVFDGHRWRIINVLGLNYLDNLFSFNAEKGNFEKPFYKIVKLFRDLNPKLGHGAISFEQNIDGSAYDNNWVYVENLVPKYPFLYEYKTGGRAKVDRISEVANNHTIMTAFRFLDLNGAYDYIYDGKLSFLNNIKQSNYEYMKQLITYTAGSNLVTEIKKSLHDDAPDSLAQTVYLLRKYRDVE